jgi:hypothetical protein
VARPRTGADFDELGNVWNVGAPDDLRRLGGLNAFVGRHSRNPSLVVECGPLHGHLTDLLLATLPDAVMHLVEISPANAAALRDHFHRMQAAGDPAGGRVVVHEADMADLDQLPIPRADLVLLVECLYYLDRDEQRAFVDALRRAHPRARLIVAAPTSGGDYFTEEQLLDLFAGYRLAAADRDGPQPGHGLYAFAPRRLRRL